MRWDALNPFANTFVALKNTVAVIVKSFQGQTNWQSLWPLCRGVTVVNSTPRVQMPSGQIMSPSVPLFACQYYEFCNLRNGGWIRNRRYRAQTGSPPRYQSNADVVPRIRRLPEVHGGFLWPHCPFQGFKRSVVTAPITFRRRQEKDCRWPKLHHVNSD